MRAKAKVTVLPESALFKIRPGLSRGLHASKLEDVLGHRGSPHYGFLWPLQEGMQSVTSLGFHSL